MDEIRIAGERAPSLEAVLDSIPGGRGVFIEVKDPPHIVPGPIDMVERSGIAVDADVNDSFDSPRPGRRALWLTGFKRRGEG